MDKLIAKFTDHLTEGVAIGGNLKALNRIPNIQNVVITGLGGSGIGGTIISQLLKQHCAVPIIVNKGYFLPSFVNEHTLVIASSYSGNTEETLSAVEFAISKNAHIACITSGGKLKDIAIAKNIFHSTIPGGLPPRSAFGYSFTQLFYILRAHALCDLNFQKDINSAIKLLKKEENDIHIQAKLIAEHIFEHRCVIYSDESYEGVAIRLRQQLNENSKELCWHHALPEMNHNELVGWAGGDRKIAVILLRNKTDYTRTQSRMEFSKEVFAKYTDNCTEIWSKGASEIEKTLYLIHIGDWISYYLSVKNDVDNIEVEIIDKLKNTLSKI